MKLGKRQTAVFALLGVSFSLNYYMQSLILRAQTFSDGILIGFVMGLLAISSLTTIYLWLRIIYLNLKVMKHGKSIKTS